MASRGLILEGPKNCLLDPIKVRVCKPGDEKGPYDVVFVTLKSQQLAPSAQHLRSLVTKDGVMVFPQNGIPWWYFQGVPSNLRDARLKSLDPEGVLTRTFEQHMIIGGIALKPSNLIAPGHIRLEDTDADALIIGEIDNTVTPRVQSIAEIATRAGWPGKVSNDIR